MTTEQQLDVAFRIRRAVCNISEKSPSFARSVIDQFLKFIAPSMARGNGVDFPFTCRRHWANAEHAAHGTNGKWPTLYFHIGNAILGFYDGVRGIECPNLIERLNLLDAIARFDLEAFVAVGTDAEGYRLINRGCILTTEDLHAVPTTEQGQGELHDPGRDAGVSVPGSPLLLRS